MNQTLSDRQIVLERTFNFPRDLVWRAYTEPEHFAKWFGPDGFTTTVQHMDVRTGGSSQFIMHAPDGTDYPNYMSYSEVIKVELLAFDHGAHEGDPDSFLVRTTFEETAEGTHLSSLMTFPSAEECERVKGFGAVELGQQTMRKLDEYLQLLRFRSETT